MGSRVKGPISGSFGTRSMPIRDRPTIITNTDDAEMDKLIDAYRDSLDEDQRIELAHRIQTRVHEIGRLCAHLYGSLFPGGLLAMVASARTAGNAYLGKPVRTIRQ